MLGVSEAASWSSFLKSDMIKLPYFSGGILGELLNTKYKSLVTAGSVLSLRLC